MRFKGWGTMNKQNSTDVFVDEQRLRSLGWKSLDRRFPRIVAHSATSQKWVASRIWSAASHLTSTTVPRRRAARIVVGIEGMGRVAVRDRSYELPPKHILVVRSDSPVVISCEKSWARFYWEFDDLERGDSLLLRALQGPRLLPDLYWNLIAATTNTVVTRAEQDDIRFDDPFLNESVLTLFSAAVVNSLAVENLRSDELSRRFLEAIQLIEARHSDRALNVAQLARLLGVSIPHLHRVFAAQDTTPGREIERHRVLSAHALITSRQRSGRHSAEAVARLSGFTSTRRMRDALQRFEEDNATSLGA